MFWWLNILTEKTERIRVFSRFGFFIPLVGIAPYIHTFLRYSSHTRPFPPEIYIGLGFAGGMTPPLPLKI